MRDRPTAVHTSHPCHGYVMKRVLLFCSIFLTLLLVLTGGPVPIEATGPWQWEMSLKGGPSGSPMRWPSALYVDPARERYYVADPSNDRLLSFDKAGQFLNAFNANGQLKTPFDMVRDEAGRIWVVEKGRNSLTQIDLETRKVIVHSLEDNGKAIFPDRLEQEGDTLYVLDKANGEILVLGNDLKVKSRFNCGECGGGFVDFKLRGGTVWALEQQEKAVYQLSSGGELESKIALGDAVQFPSSLEVGPTGLIYVLDRHGGVVTVFDAEDGFKYRFLGPGQARGQLYFPTELRFDPWGRLCVVEEGNGRVEVFGR